MWRGGCETSASEERASAKASEDGWEKPVDRTAEIDGAMSGGAGVSKVSRVGCVLLYLRYWRGAKRELEDAMGRVQVVLQIPSRPGHRENPLASYDSDSRDSDMRIVEASVLNISSARAQYRGTEIRMRAPLRIDRLLIPPAYISLYEKLMQAERVWQDIMPPVPSQYRAVNLHRHHLFQEPPLAGTGNPSSSFLIYFLLRRLSSRQRSVFVTSNNNTFIFTEQGVRIGATQSENWQFLEGVLEEDSDHDDTLERPIWCLFDRVTPEWNFRELPRLVCLVATTSEGVVGKEEMRTVRRESMPKEWWEELRGWEGGG